MSTDTPPPPVTAGTILAALAQIKRRGQWPILQMLEQREPELANHIFEELSLVQQTLLASGAAPKVVRRLQRQVQSLVLVCTLTLAADADSDGAKNPRDGE